MNTKHTSHSDLKPMSAIGVWICVLFTSGLYAFYWLWQQSRSNKTVLDRRLKHSAEFAAICIIIYLFIFFISLFWALSSRGETGTHLPALGLIIALITLVYTSLFACIVFLTQKLNSLSARKTSAVGMILLTFAWLLSFPILQKRINELQSGQT